MLVSQDGVRGLETWAETINGRAIDRLRHRIHNSIDDIVDELFEREKGSAKM